MLRRVSGKRLGFTVDDLRVLFEEAEERVGSLSRSELIEFIVDGGVERVEPYDLNTWIIYDRDTPRILSGWLTPSAIYSYMICPRMFALDILYRSRLGGRLVTLDAMRVLARGRVFHELYASRLASGETELRVEDNINRIFGFIDEVRVDDDDNVILVEVKSGYRANTKAAALQAMAYKLAYETVYNEHVDEVYIASPGGIYLLDADTNKAKAMLYEIIDTILAIVEQAKVGHLPEPVNTKYCQSCPYRKYCQTPLKRPKQLTSFF